jgi:predicted polyphosphate/ATP-dependent NAD kinase
LPVKLGLIVNPIAGMGGAVGLKGTDGEAVWRRALALGATPRAPQRAAAALQAAGAYLAGVEIMTAPGAMGAEVLTACGLKATVVGSPLAARSSAEDTREVARLLVQHAVDLLLFAGGDGTARDILEVVGTAVPVLGVPAGVKLHSGVFATSPRAAGELVRRMVAGHAPVLRAGEVMDINEEEYRAGRVSARLFGYLRVPNLDRAVQQPKARSSPEAVVNRSIALAVIQLMDEQTLWLFGPGTTTGAVLEELGLAGSLLGVDVIRGGRIVARDVNERGLLELVEGRAARILVTPVGGQGFLFGRGNHQLSGRVIGLVGTANIVVVATPAKLAGLRGAPLLLDLDDEGVSAQLAGYRRIITGVGQEVVYPVGRA